jgi:Plasmid pRiA4b ORF-3-like protein
MIWMLKIELLFGLYAKEECIRFIEIDSSSTLEDLHLAIQDAVDFDNDHLYEFYISRTERSRDRIRFDDENGGIYEVTLASLYPLEKRKKLFYLFDYGDNWVFQITKSRKKPTEPKKGIKYPRVVERVGKNPEQYPLYDG